MANWKIVDADMLAQQGGSFGFDLGPCDCVTIQAVGMIPNESVAIQKVVGFDPVSCQINTAPLTKSECGGECEYVELTKDSCEVKYCEEGQFLFCNAGTDADGEPVVGNPTIRYSITKGGANCCK